jgi:hypothetical protein
LVKAKIELENSFSFVNRFFVFLTMTANTQTHLTPFPVCLTHYSYLHFSISSNSLKKGNKKYFKYDYYTYYNPQLPKLFSKNHPDQQPYPPRTTPEKVQLVRISIRQSGQHPSVEISAYKHKNKS